MNWIKIVSQVLCNFQHRYTVFHILMNVEYRIPHRTSPRIRVFSERTLEGSHTDLISGAIIFLVLPFESIIQLHKSLFHFSLTFSFNNVDYAHQCINVWVQFQPIISKFILTLSSIHLVPKIFVSNSQIQNFNFNKLPISTTFDFNKISTLAKFQF